MTRLRILSDLHLEFRALHLEPRGEDILILAGDTMPGLDGLYWASRYYERTGIATIMVAGNHEFYNRAISLYKKLEHAAMGVIFLENRQFLAPLLGVRFIGATLWTDYRLGNLSLSERNVAKARAAIKILDHKLIWHGERNFTPDDASRLHAASVAYLRTALATPFAGKTVVVTHHLPSARSIAPRYANDPLNPAFASDLDDLVQTSGAALWVHGHTHASADYHLGATRVLCNPRGYYPHELNSDFDVDLVVKI